MILNNILWVAVIISASSIFPILSRQNKDKSLRIATKLLVFSGLLTILWMILFVSYRILSYLEVS